MSESALSFGIKTTPANVSYGDILRVWLDADAIHEIEHAWLYDHLLPRVGAGSEPIYEAWTLLTALAAQTRRLRVGVLATNNRIRHPAVLAKIAAGVDEISNGRLDFGIGVGGLSKSDPRFATMVAPEYEAFGIPVGGWGAAVAGLSEACTIIRRLWSGEEFDFAGEHYRLIGARCSPAPIQQECADPDRGHRGVDAADRGGARRPMERDRTAAEHRGETRRAQRGSRFALHRHRTRPTDHHAFGAACDFV